MQVDVEVAPRKKQIQKKKYHVLLDPKTEEKKFELQAKYENMDKHLAVIDQIDECDVVAVLEEYSKNLNVDLYHVAETFNIHPATLNVLLHSDKYKDLYQSAKDRRNAVYERVGFEVASSPYDKIQKGEEVSMVEVASAKLKSNYCLAISQANNKRSSNSGGVNVTVNTGIALKI